MIEIILYNNTSDNDEVHKHITQISSANCDIFGECSIESPQLLLSMNDNIINANYLYIPKFNRYYYITNKTIYDGSKVIINARVDVLMSFWNDMKNSDVIATRSSSKYDVYIPDNMIQFSSKLRFEYRKLPFNFSPTESGKHYVLTLGGTI